MGVICSAPCCNWCPSIPCCGYEEKRDLSIHPLHHWVEMVAKSNPDLPLSQMRGICSHDAGTYSISKHKCCSSVSRTQCLDLYGQLMAGSRILDYRYGPKDKINKDALVVQHGMHQGGESYYDGFKGVLRFLKENPNEFIILDVTKEFGTSITHEQQKYLMDYFEKEFGSYSLKQEDLDTWAKGFPNVSIGKILDQPNKRVLILVDKYLFNYEEVPGVKMDYRHYTAKGLFARDDFLECRWHDKPHCFTIFMANRCYIKERPNPQKLFVCQYILTPQSTCKDIAKYIFGCDRLRVDQKTYTLLRNQRLHNEIREAASESNFCFVMMDFVHYDPYINHFLIGSNFKEKITILHANIVRKGVSLDVTDRANQLVTNGNSLWIVNFKKDLRLEQADGTLYIAFKFSTDVGGSGFKDCDKIYADPPFDFNASSQYLLNALRGKLDAARPIEEFSNNQGLKKESSLDTKFHDFLGKCSSLFINSMPN